MPLAVNFRPLTKEEERTYGLKCSAFKDKSTIQCPKKIFVAMETETSDGILPVRYFCEAHGLYKKMEVDKAVLLDNASYGLKLEHLKEEEKEEVPETKEEEKS